MEQGTYLQCTKCNKTNNCCCNFEKIDRPIISKDEKEKIELCYINNDNKKLFQELTNECFNINTINNKRIFYDGKCKIYNGRQTVRKIKEIKNTSNYVKRYKFMIK